MCANNFMCVFLFDLQPELLKICQFNILIEMMKIFCICEALIDDNIKFCVNRGGNSVLEVLYDINKTLVIV